MTLFHHTKQICLGNGVGGGVERVNDFASKTGKRADVKKH